MRATPPLCAQAMAESAGSPFNAFGADAAEEAGDEELLDDVELVDDDGLLRGTVGRPSSRRAKKAAARSELITIRWRLCLPNPHPTAPSYLHTTASSSRHREVPVSRFLARILRDHAAGCAKADPCPRAREARAPIRQRHVGPLAR